MFIDHAGSTGASARARPWRWLVAGLLALFLVGCGGGKVPVHEEYTLGYRAAAGGSLSGATQQTVAHGGKATAVTAVPDSGYHFVTWSDGGSANPRQDIDLSGPLSVTATFAINQYQVGYSAGEGGSVDGDLEQTVNHGEDATPVTAVAGNGYRFVEWSDGRTDNPRTDTGLTDDLSVTAQFIDDGLVLAVNEKHFAPLWTGEKTVRNSDTETAEYVLIPMNLTRATLALPISVALTNGVDAPTLSALSDASLSGAVNERQAQKVDALARFGTVGTGTPLPAGAGIPAGVPQVGDIWQMNVNLTDACDGAVLRAAQVKVVSTHSVILEDVDNPSGGFPVDHGQYDQDYTEIASIFDDSVYPAVTSLLGDTPDRDGNGRVVLFYTKAVNELEPVGSQVVPVGRYLIRDRLSRVECPAGNGGEVVYMKVPDPTGSVNRNLLTLSYIFGQSGIQPAMEVALMIADDRHLRAGPALPDRLLDKGLAGLGAGSVFYQTSFGLEPLHRIVLADLISGPDASRRVAAFNTYQNLQVGELRDWLQSPWRSGVISAEEQDTRARGLAWAFLRYVSDRQAIASNNPPLVSAADAVAYQLAGSAQSDWDTLEDITGGVASDWLRDFLVTLYLDGPASVSVPGYQTAAPYQMASWNFKSVYDGLGGHPLNALTLSEGQGNSLNLAAAGGALYLRFSVAAGYSSMLAFEAVPSQDEDARYALVRLK